MGWLQSAQCNLHGKKALNFCLSPGCNQALCPRCIQEHIKYHSEVKTIQQAFSKAKIKIDCLIQQIESQILPFQSIRQEMQKNARIFEQRLLQITRKLVQSIQQAALAKQKEFNLSMKQYEQRQEKRLQLWIQSNRQRKDTLREMQRALHSKMVVKGIKDIMEYKSNEPLQNMRLQKIDISFGDNCQSVVQEVKSTFRTALPSAKIQVIKQEKIQPYSQLQRLMTQVQKQAETICYFEPGTKFFHQVKITKGRSEWKTYKLSIGFQIPLGCRSVLCQNGKYYVIGGIDRVSEQLSNKVYVLEMKSANLVQVSSIGRALYNFGACSNKNTVYIVGGISQQGVTNKCIELEVQRNAASQLGKLHNRCQRASVATFNKALIKVGGQAMGQIIQTIQIYDFKTSQWFVADYKHEWNMPRIRIGLSAGLLQLTDTDLLVFGGGESGEASDKCVYLTLSINKGFLMRSAGSLALAQPSSFQSSPIVTKAGFFCMQEEPSLQLHHFNGECWQVIRK